MIKLIDDGEDKLAYVTLSLKFARKLYPIDYITLTDSINTCMEQEERYRQATHSHHNHLKVVPDEVIGSVVDVDLESNMVVLELNDYGVNFLYDLQNQKGYDADRIYIRPRCIGFLDSSNKTFRINKVLCFDLLAR